MRRVDPNQVRRRSENVRDHHITIFDTIRFTPADPEILRAVKKTRAASSI
jgi:hypothetical protein